MPASGGESRRLNPTPNHEERPRFSPDGKRLIWTSKPTDPTQIWMCDFDPGAGQLVGKSHQVTSISTGADGAIWSPDGKNIVFVSAVYPDCKDDACNKQRDEELKKSKVKAKVFTRLFYRHWNAFTEFKRSHLFVVSAEATPNGGGACNVWRARRSRPPNQEPRDHTGRSRRAALSQAARTCMRFQGTARKSHTSNIDEIEATSTNNEIFIVPITGGTPKKISTSSAATPRHLPAGRECNSLAAQARAGFEADKWNLLVYYKATGETQNATASSTGWQLVRG